MFIAWLGELEGARDIVFDEETIEVDIDRGEGS